MEKVTRHQLAPSATNVTIKQEPVKPENKNILLGTCEQTPLIQVVKINLPTRKINVMISASYCPLLGYLSMYSLQKDGGGPAALWLVHSTLEQTVQV